METFPISTGGRLTGPLQTAQYFGWRSIYFASAGFWLVYACIAISTVLGFGLRGRVNGARVLGYSLAE